MPGSKLSVMSRKENNLRIHGRQKAVNTDVAAFNPGVVIKSGSWYAYNNEKIGQGRENAKKYFMENPAIMEEVEQKVRDFYNIDGTQQEEAEQPVGEE